MLSEPRCFTRQCKWFSGVNTLTKGEEDTEVPVCVAFPQEIPEDIAYGDNPHSTPQKGQLGNFVFEKAQQS